MKWVYVIPWLGLLISGDVIKVMVELIHVFSLFVDGLFFFKKIDTIFIRNIKGCKKNCKKVLKIFF